MKKILLFALAALLVVAWAMPVMAKVHMGGIVFVDVMYIKNDEHFQRNTAAIASAANSLDASRSWFTIDVPDITRLYGKWTNDAGDVGMHIEIGLRGEEGGGEAVNTRYAYAWWQINPMFKLTVGQQNEVIAPYACSQMLGMRGKLAAGPVAGLDNTMLHVIGYGFGQIGNDRKEGVRLDTKLGEKSNLAIAIFNPNVNGAQGSWAARDEEEVLPRLDIVYSVSLGGFSLAPGFSWQKVQYEWDPQCPNNQADFSDFDVWVWSLPVKFAPGGPISVTAELNWGENVGNGSYTTGVYTGGPTNRAQFDNPLVNGVPITQVADTEFLGLWVDLAWKAHPVATIHLIYGMQQVSNDDRLAQANRWDNTRTMYGISIPIAVAKTFIIRPELFVYDYGEFEQNGQVNPANGDLGSQTVIGVQFQIVF